MERLFAALGACCALIPGLAATAGPLTPPGAPASSMKTLDHVEPSTPISTAATPGDVDALFVISQPGAYHLTNDVAGVAGKHGVQILAHDVTLDLRGFTLRGAAAGLDGVRVGETAGPLVNNVVIRNGRATGWGGSGFRADRANRSSMSMLFSVSNDGYGILAGAAARVSDCVAEANALTNIAVAGQSIVERSTALRGEADGFTGASTTIFAQCVAFLNAGDGFRPGAGATLTECLTSGNTGDGYDGGARNTFARCTSIFDGARGIAAGADSIIERCLITGSPQGGVVVGDGGRVIDCTISAATGVGVSGGAFTTVERCTIRNATVGVSVGATSRVEQCLIASMGEDGVRATSHSRVVNNAIDNCGTAVGFDGAGVRATDVANHIEGNSATRCDYGFRLDAAGNVVIGNSAGVIAIAAFDAPAGNAVGPILTGATITSSPAPNANFAP